MKQDGLGSRPVNILAGDPKRANDHHGQRDGMDQPGRVVRRDGLGGDHGHDHQTGQEATLGASRRGTDRQLAGKQRDQGDRR